MAIGPGTLLPASATRGTNTPEEEELISSLAEASGKTVPIPVFWAFATEKNTRDTSMDRGIYIFIKIILNDATRSCVLKDKH